MSLSRTQDPSSSTRHRVRLRRLDVARSSRAPQRRDMETVESGKRFSWGRRGEAYYVWANRTPGESRGHSGEAAARREFRWLEQEAKVRRRRLSMRLLIGAGLLCIAAAPAVIVMYADGSAGQPQQVADAVEPKRLVNDEGGYSFRAPAGWSVQTEGSSSLVTNPNGNATISVLVAPEGDIAAASEASIGSIAADWTDTQAETPQARTLGDLPAISVGGTAIDGSGEPIRFLLIVIDSGVRNHAIWVSVPENADAATFLPSIEEILESFKPREAA